jgi:Protein of unknown function (DUF1501)
MARPVTIDCEGFHRRDFLRLGSAGFLGLDLSGLLRLEARAAGTRARARSVIMIWLAGGPATIDIWDLKPHAPENIRGEFKPIATSARGIWICEQLPRSAKIMERCTLVRGLHHNLPEHGLGTQYMTTGNRPTPALEYPALGCLASKLVPPPSGIAPCVNFSGFRGPGSGYLGAAYSAFEVEGSPQRGQLRVQGMSLPSSFSLSDLDNRDKLRDAFDAAFKVYDRSDVAASMDTFHQQALDILRSDKTRTAFDLDREPSQLRDDYGRGRFGQAALAARRLIEAGVRFVTISLGGWDTHAANFATLRAQLLPQLDQTFSALIVDLDKKGLLETTIVYCAGEFGRTPQVNGQAGRDHWAGSMAVLLAGGGIKRGFVHGSTDSQGMVPARDPCSPDDISATIFQRLGIAPNTELLTTTGRPVAIFRAGKVLDELLA